MQNLDDRYNRQILFPGIGDQGQQRLTESTVLLVGCGALGSTQAELLARAGVGHIILFDRDVLEASNLQRQQLYDESDVLAQLPKAIAAKQRLERINSSIRITAHTNDLTAATIEDALKGVDLVLDGTDNFETRFLVNDACLKHNIPWIYGACVSSYGLVMTIIPEQTPCLRCVFEEMPPPGTLQTCDTAGVIAPIVNVIASLQCTEALKYLTGRHDKLRKGLLNVDLWENTFVPVGLSQPREACPACQQREYTYLKGEHAQQTTVLCGRNTVQVMPASPSSIDLGQLATQLSPHGKVTQNPFLLRLALEDKTITVFPDGRALIEGTKQAAEARSLYARYIGA
jgi:adenylyltransferase/sulfurtransferase